MTNRDKLNQIVEKLLKDASMFRTEANHLDEYACALKISVLGCRDEDLQKVVDAVMAVMPEMFSN